MKKLSAFTVGLASAFNGVAASFLSMCRAVDTCWPSSVKPEAKPDAFEGFRKDREALASDWKKVGSDIRNAMNSYVETH